jgi:hypothetical protein
MSDYKRSRRSPAVGWCGDWPPQGDADEAIVSMATVEMPTQLYADETFPSEDALFKLTIQHIRQSFPSQLDAFVADVFRHLQVNPSYGCGSFVHRTRLALVSVH